MSPRNPFCHFRWALATVCLGIVLTKSVIGYAANEPPAAPKDSARPKPSLAFNLDFRNSFLANRPVNIWGLNTGIIVGRKRHQFTLGYYWLGYNAAQRLIDLRRNASQRLNLTYYTKNDLWFLSVMSWWNLIYGKHWVMSIPVEIGGGEATAFLHETRTDLPANRTRNDFFVPAQIGLYGEWKATRWVGVSAQIGYRHSVRRSEIKNEFDGMYYSVGAVIYPAVFQWAWGKVRGRNNSQ
jgi:hypothetical protein